MSLYGDLPQAKDDDTGSKGWAAASKKLQPTFRKPASLLAPPSVVRGGRGSSAAGRTPLAAGGRGGGRSISGPPPAAITNAPQPLTTTSTTNSSSSSGRHGMQHQQPAAVASSASAFLTSLTGQPLNDEYDPARPNDYEALMRERQQQQRAAEEEGERLARLREAEQEIERRKREQAEAAAFIAAASQPPPGVDPAALAAAAAAPAAADDEAAHTFQGLGSSSGGGGSAAAIDPQQQQQQQMDDDEYERERQRRLKLSGDEAFRARARLSGASPGGFDPSDQHQQQQQQQQQPPPGFSSPQNPGSLGEAAGGRGMGLAQKLLEKMGWREGQGLGRFRQGMATPLVAQKTAAHAGVIVNADQPADKRPRLVGAALRGTPTRVLLLANMVGPGEVDEDLEEEVGTELSKYGAVQEVTIFEVTSPGFPAEEAVRIFVRFDRPESATRCLVDLQGRFFGGRQVRAAFFSEERFERQQLAPQPGEFE